MTRFSRVGSNPRRPDGMDKVSGRAKYVDDLTRPGMWHGATVRSPHAHARIVSVRWNAANAPADAICVTARDIQGINGVQLLDDTWPILASDEVLHVGQAVALVAAPTPAAARAARDAVEIEYEVLPPVLTWEDAENAEPLNELELVKGDPSTAFAKANAEGEGEGGVLIKHEYHTGHQEHIYIECQGMIGWVEPDGTLTVQGSMQCPYYVHKALQHTFDLPEKRIRVLPAAVGGGFGGKEDYPSLLALHVALLAIASKHPVKIIYDRQEDIIATTKRHPALITHRTLVAPDGSFTAMDIEVLLDGGAYRTLSPVVLSRAVIHAAGPYKCANIRIRGRVLRTHTAPNAAFRGFGAPQVLYAVERQVDAIARRVGLDPLTIRLQNAVRPGDTTATDQVMRQDASAIQCLEAVEKRTNFKQRWMELEAARARRQDGETLKGIGLSLYFHGAGFTGSGEHRMASPVTVRLTAEGKIEVLTVQTDMGQGCIVVLPQIAADAAGVTLEDLQFPDPDTAIAPDSGPTVASRTTMVVGGTVAKAVTALRDQVLEWASEEYGITHALGLEDGLIRGTPEPIPFREVARACFASEGDLELTVHHEPPAWQIFDDATYHGVAYATYGWGADVVEVEVDPDTLEIKPTRATVACEVGRVIHPTLCTGQIEGGTLQAVAWGYLEEIKLDQGRYLNDRLQTYIIPTIQDTPVMDIILLENPWEGGAFGAKGVGELPMDGGAPALVAALENATGIQAPDIPATPERLFAWRRQGRMLRAAEAGRAR